MPVSSETSITGPYTPNGVTTSFAFDFKAASASEVVATDGDGNVISTALYSVALDTDEGGTLTFSVAPELADYPQIYVVSEPDLTQPSDFDNTGPSFNPAALTRAIDRAAIRDLKQQRQIDRAFLVPFGEDGLPLPSATSRANGFLAFDNDGNPVMSPGTGADAGLRQALAQDNAADDLIGTASGDGLQADLNARPTAATLAEEDAADTLGTITGNTVQTELSARNALDLSPVMIDLYWGVMRGAGWATGDPGDGASQKGSTFAASASSGATSVTVASATFFVDDQLIAFQGTDTLWYTTRISTVSGTTLTLAEPLPADVSNGGLVGAWFNDYNHPREYGRYAIADYILAQLETANKRELIAVQRNWDDWKAYGGTSTVTAIGSDSYSNPGANATGLQGANVAASTVGHGAISDPVFLPAGNYEVVVPVNPGDVGGARNTVRLFVEEEGVGTTTLVTTSVTLVGLDSIQLAVIRVSKGQASRVRIYADGRTAGSFSFQLGAIRWYRTTAKLADLTSGTWVALGDSWFDSPWILDRLEDRMPNVTLIREGVSGNKASDLITRFAADVTVHNPRVVLICVGTNDWAASIDRVTFASQIQQLIRMCQSIGAQAVLLNCSVGDIATSPQLANSRQYAAALEYEVQNLQDQHVREGVYRGDTITVAAGAKAALFVSSVPVNRAVLVDYAAWAASVTGLNIVMGFTGSLTPPVGSLDDELAFGATTFETAKIVANKADTSTRRYFMIAAYNTTGASQTLTFHNFKIRVADFYR